MFRSFPAEEHVFGNPQRPCPPGSPTAVERGPLSVTLSGPLTLHLAFYAFPNAAGFLTRRRKILPTSPLRREFGLSWSQARVASAVYGKDGEKQGEVWRPAGEQSRPARGHSVCHPTRSPDVGQCLGGSSPARKTQTAHAHMTLEHSSSQESSFSGGSFSYSLTVPRSSRHPASEWRVTLRVPPQPRSGALPQHRTSLAQRTAKSYFAKNHVSTPSVD